MSRFRDAAPPWSFFIPTTLAVIVGVLAADAIRYAIGSVFGGDDALVQVDAGSPEPAAPEPVAPASPAGTDVGAVPGAASDDGQEVPFGHAASRNNGVLELPDSMTARREGAAAACVNGSVANRVQGGWEQALENDAPVPCVVVNR